MKQVHFDRFDREVICTYHVENYHIFGVKKTSIYIHIEDR